MTPSTTDMNDHDRQRVLTTNPTGSMGGKALKTITTTRKSPEDYEQIKAYVLRRLDEGLINTGCRWAVPHEAPEKTTYGDLDVLISRDPGFTIHDIRMWISDTFHPDELVNNGGIISFNIPDFGPAGDFQIDFITAPAGQFEAHRFFLSWGDLGILIGRIVAGALGLRFGLQGLFLKYSERPNVSDDLLLSDSPDQICEFLGLDYQKWENGFGDERAIFEWLWESAHLRGMDYRHGLRKDQRDRGMYQRFFEYANKEHPVPECPVAAVPSPDTAIAYFGKEIEFAAIKRKQARPLIRSDKFGPRLFSVLGDLSGRELGRIINGFKQAIPGDFKEWALATEEEDIQLAVTEYLCTAGLITVTSVTECAPIDGGTR